ncbi:universal stress protein [Nocardioides sp. SYSU DS0651]|uniref:universal stress protein n=1 Tax=Nocardioides sp. SYSU DS0651 TaxID=3415955 RepID=UPI003F4C8CDB
MTNNIQPGTIVVATDGSDDADRAIHWAAEQAWYERRLLTVVTATGAPSVPSAPWDARAAAYTAHTQDLVEAAQAVADEALAVVRRMRPGVQASATAVVGDARQVLVDLSADAHLVVVGSRGHGPLRSKLLGSVSAAVSRDAACPVVVCRPPRRRSAQDIDTGVLVGADGTPESLPVIEFAFQQASMRGLPLTLMHSVWDQLAALHGLVAAPATEDDEQRLLLAESVAGFAAKFPEVRVELLPARGMPEDCLTADSARWDLIVVGRHPVDTVLRLVTGAVATAVVEHAHTAVAVVPQAEPAPQS